MRAISPKSMAILTLLVAVLPERSLAQTSSDLNLDAPPTTEDGITAVAARATAADCRTPSCKAIITIAGILAIETDRDMNETMGAVRDNGQSEIAQQRMDRVLFHHPELYGPVCSLAVKMFSRVHLKSNIDAQSPSVTLLEDAIDMDLLDHGHCAEALITALPKDPDNDRIRILGRDACLYDFVGHPRPQAACAAVARGAIDRGY